MRALRIVGYAETPHVELVSLEASAPGPGEVRILVEAAALNPLDAKLARGAMRDWFPLSFPYVPGTDFAGIVEAVGDGVTALRQGDPVFGRAEPVRGGALATQIVVPADVVAPRPAGLDAVTAACLPTPAGVAHQALFDALGVESGRTLLILGAGGSVGSAARQLAPGGMEVIASMSASSLSRARARSGPTDVRFVGEDGFDAAAARADYVLDCTGGDHAARILRLLRPGARFVGLVSPPDADVARERGVAASFVVLATDKGRLDTLAALAISGSLAVERPEVIGMDRVPYAYAAYVAGALVGKHVMVGRSA